MPGKKNKTLTATNTLAVLDKIPLFQQLDEQEKQLLSEFLWHFRIYQPGHYLTDEGSRDNRFFILLSGQVNVLKGPAQTLLCQLQPGEIMGEIAFLTGEPRTASLVADTPVSVLIVDQPLLDELPVPLREKLKDQIILRLAHRLNKMNQRLSD